jgi:uncharacterized membrane protein
MNTFAGCFWIVVASAIVLFFPLQVIAFLLIIILAALIVAASTDAVTNAYNRAYIETAEVLKEMKSKLDEASDKLEKEIDELD